MKILYRHLGQRVQLECDGQRIPLPELQGIVVLNISSFMGGTNFWGGTRGDDIFLAPSFDDRILEVSEKQRSIVVYNPKSFINTFEFSKANMLEYFEVIVFPPVDIGTLSRLDLDSTVRHPF